MVEFNNINELFERVYPCLKLKKKLLYLQGVDVSIKFIWDYFTDDWKNSINLTLYDMVNDIMMLDVNNLKEV
ncbi:MAG: hypothetical protein IJL76_01660 [Bacilli bacterium]|nr:hypothetical protein [Bacilli bacterium]